MNKPQQTSLPSSQHGFTLIEVMVAVAVIAVALPALVYAMTGQIDSSAYMRDRMQANWVAENVMAETRIKNRTGQVIQKKDSGKTEIAGRKWRWALRSQPFPQKELQGVFGVEVDVFLDDGSLSKVPEKDQKPLANLVGIMYRKPTEPISVPAPEKYSGTANSNSNSPSGTGN
ncbi:Type II secretion system protein I [BD1-7 clade bacterium]|uniref:Type II secretion system protein I n=1 Tax=BD1-7 clade bacterium TaxID=2029982 RepID=A0A5S9PPR5_9GAMM|nr:Type II secretion system protein I [BD1-7 clade bacterium]CAA0106309.1 Type II secretion system protein I [BD1-7 clade bacterium]